MPHQSTTRFSKTIKYYDWYRPGYPNDIIQFLKKELNFSTSNIIADIGSGTGKMTKLFLENNNKVYAIEPNKDMRNFASELFKEYQGFVSIEGTAENTTLSSQSVDMIVVAQAFHWFDYKAFREECQRILKPGGWVVLIWNKRIDDRSTFMKSYNDFLNNFATDYQKVNLRYVDHKIFQAFYGHENYQLYTCEHAQVFDLNGLEGRYLSCSYAYHATHPEHKLAMNRLGEIFQAFQEDDRVQMWYRSEMYYGMIK